MATITKEIPDNVVIDLAKMLKVSFRPLTPEDALDIIQKHLDAIYDPMLKEVLRKSDPDIIAKQEEVDALSAQLDTLFKSKITSIQPTK